MENFVKGAGLWTELEHTLSDPSAKDTVDSVVLSLAKDQRTTMEDKGGWGYYTDDDPSEDPSDREEEALRLMGLEDDVEFIYAKAWLWRNPDFFLSGIYNCQHGIWSTQSTYIKYQSDPGKPPGSPDRLSEVMWALWMKVCPNEVENLRWIIQDHASNQNSLKLLKEAAQARDNYNEHDLAAHSGDVTTWEPGIFETPITAHSCDQAAGACDFYSILRAPNTIGVAYLLKDKAQRLRKTISRISAFYLYDEEADEDISSQKRLAHTTTGCGKQGFPSAQPYLSHTPVS
ncbi:hypothetical protein N7492_001023 [Penicillium capsulatum]|uniref:Uncharacterized protein n=1 Tax=Penicillium capsulatum TaxID=69766 RepID=A0A9W9ISW2_9EURO|nr:hypothetical protein N7492_001023 [Penicillium capsulatum]KAJ6129917.1 hypothetical protein N7512_002697 [Penicillium capsulatum]